MTPETYTALTAVDIAQGVKARRFTAREVTEAALSRIAAENPRLNAVAVARHEALDEADRVDVTGQLAENGVAVLIKAENDVAGLPTTFGGRANDVPAQADSEVVRRLRAAGAVILGTTHMPEFGQYPFTESAAWGMTRNPHDVNRTPGGSSGGSAAAVASGMVPVAIGGDGGGSIRIPASCCGIVGLKPVRGRVSSAPHADLWGALGTIGPLTRTLADTALVYDAISGSTDVDRFSAPSPRSSFLDAATAAPTPLRIGWLTRAPFATVRTDREVAAAVSGLAARLAAAGHRVHQVTGRWPDAQLSFVPQFYAAVRAESGRVARPELLEARTRSTRRAGAWVTPRVLELAERRGAALAAAVEERFADLDVVLSPTISCVPPTVGRLDGVGTTRALRRSLPLTAFTSLANVTGHAAMSMPVGTCASGLPIGVQLYAPGGDETSLLPLGAQIEALTRG